MPLKARLVYTLIGMFLVGFVFGTMLVTGTAQAPTSAPAAAAAPALDAASKAKLETVQRAAQLANTSCQALEAVKVYNDIRALVQTDLEAKYPNYTVNWQTFTLMPKATK